MKRRKLMVLGLCSALALAVAVPAIAGDFHSSDGVGNNQACGTTAANPPVTTCYTGPTAIQSAVTSAGAGGTVNVGNGTFDPITLTDGLTLLGSGHDTIISGPVNETTNTSLIYAYKSAPGFTHPLTIKGFDLQGTAASATRGSEITLRDQNQSNLDTITNNEFSVSKGAQGSVRGLYSYNSYAPLVLTQNSFEQTQYGVLLETGNGSGSVMFGASTISGNEFDHLAKAPAPHGAVAAAIQLTNDSPGTANAGVQDYSGNSIEFDPMQTNSTALDVTDNGTATGLATVGFHFNNLDHVDLGVINETGKGPISATDTFWGCPQGPNVNPSPGSGNKDCAAAFGNPAVTFTMPYLTDKAQLQTGSNG